MSHPAVPPPSDSPRMRVTPSVSRRVRLRRTVAGALVLILLVVAASRLITRERAAEAADSLPGVNAQAAQASPEPSRTTASPSPTTTGGPRTTATPVPPVPQRGDGKIKVLAVPGPQSKATGRAVRYTVEAEGGLGVDPAEFASTVRSVLLNGNGWQPEDDIRFVNVSPAEAEAGSRVDIRVTLASPALTDRLCAPLRTMSEVSCWNGERSVLNLKRWQLGDDSYGDDVATYRVYLVNHEVGHGLGHGHVGCPGKGKRAPIMLQQTLGLEGCTAWPYPKGA